MLVVFEIVLMWIVVTLDTARCTSATTRLNKIRNVKTKMAKWSGSADSGILRKKPPEKHEELLVFGYACKLFRDDEKALYIDQGKHLIPWMGDEKLKIDRLYIQIKRKAI